tara:strand:- start:158 stop:427 length:270 start_codon:yes stop_codon:yes gene_type:complete
VKIYTTTNCSFCESAKRFLEQKGIGFEAIDCTSDRSQLMALMEKHSWRTVPMIFINNEFIGGFRELVAFDANGQLEKSLREDSLNQDRL